MDKLTLTAIDEPALAARIARLEEELGEAREKAAELAREAESLRARLLEAEKTRVILRELLEVVPAWVFVKDQEHRYRVVSRDYADVLHRSPESFVGLNDIDLGFPIELVKGDPSRGIRGFWTDDRQVMDSGERLINPRDPATVDGSEHMFHTIKTPLRDAEGKVWAVLGFAQDVTKVFLAEDALQKSLRQQEQLIRSQQAVILELSTPLIPVHAGVVVMPIVGGVDHARAQKIMMTLLDGIERLGARTAILDVTGVAVMDSHVAEALVRAAKAARLLGTEVILTGISPAVSASLVALSADLSSVVTTGSLQQAIARALSRAGGAARAR